MLRSCLPLPSPLFLTCYTSRGGERGPVTSPAFKAGDSILSGSNGGVDSHTLSPFHLLRSQLPNHVAACGIKDKSPVFRVVLSSGTSDNWNVERELKAAF